MNEDVCFGNIQGVLSLPEGEAPFPILVLCHGFTGRMDDDILVAVSEQLVAEGIATLRFNFSDRLCPDLWITKEVEDIETILEGLQERADIDSQRIGLLGHCFSGLVVVQAALSLGDPKTIVLITPTFDLEETSRLLVGEDMGAWLRDGVREFKHYKEGESVPLSSGFYVRARRLPTIDELIAHLDCSVLAIVDPNDRINDMHKAKNTLTQAKGPHRLVWVSCERHGIFRSHELEAYLQEIVSWVKRSL